jgi:hypothetical protein
MFTLGFYVVEQKLLVCQEHMCSPLDFKLWSRKCLPVRSTCVHPWFLSRVLFAIKLSVLLRFKASDYPFSIVNPTGKQFLLH